MTRGTIVWVDLGRSDPPEFGKLRSAMVVSNTIQNERLPTVVVVPISSQSPEIWPLRIAFKGPLKKESFLVIPGMRQTAKSRLRESMGLAPPPLLEKLDQALRMYLSD